jgi:hypothetical protein
MASTRYEFRVKGRLSEEVAGDFREFEVRQAPSGTVLVGDIVDDAHLHGVLARFQSLGLQMVSLRALSD